MPSLVVQEGEGFGEISVNCLRERPSEVRCREERTTYPGMAVEPSSRGPRIAHRHFRRNPWRYDCTVVKKKYQGVAAMTQCRSLAGTQGRE
jgi:hypothetical protein